MRQDENYYSVKSVQERNDKRKNLSLHLIPCTLNLISHTLHLFLLTTYHLLLTTYYLLLITYYLLLPTDLSGSSLASPITNSPDPFGPLPATTTNIFWINRAGYTDYVDIIYDQANSIRRRLVNQNTTAGSGPIRIVDVWNGQDDNGVNCEAGTYNCKIKVSRVATFDVKIPPPGDYAEFQEPRDIACDKYGNVYVLDRALRTVQKFSSDGAFIWKWTIPAGAGITFPNWNTGGIAVCTNLYIYVSGQGAAGRGRISKIDQSGTWIANRDAPAAANDNYGGMGYAKEYDRVFTAAQLNTDNSVAVNCGPMTAWDNNTAGANTYRDFAIIDGPVATRDYIFIVDGANIRRWYMAAGGANSFPDTTDAPLNLGANGFSDTRSITQRSNRQLYIVGLGATGHRIRQLSTNGAILETRGSLGYGDTNFWAPTGVAWDEANDLIWVSDTSNQRLVCYRENAAGQLEFVRKIETSPYIMRNPQDIAIDKDGNLYVIDNGFCKVKKFDEFGNLKLVFGGKGNGNGYFRNPRGIAVDNDGYIYVSDLGTVNGDDAEDQIEKFDANGNFILAWNHPDGRGMTSFVRNGSNFIVAIGQTDGATMDCAMRVYTPTGTVVQSFQNSYDDTDYGDIDIDFLGRFYCINASGTAYVDTYPAGSSGSTTPTYVNIGGTRAGLCIDDYGTLWVPDQASDNIEARQTYAVGTPATLLYEFSGLGSADGLLNNPTFCAIRMRELEGKWADLWVVDSGNNRLQKFIINWTNQTIEPVTIANPGPPIVTAAYPDTSSTNATYVDGIYYTRQGKATFKIYFSQNMNTNVNPTIQFITADNFTYTIYKTSYIGNVWIGTAWISTGHDGAADIRVENAQNTFGSNLNPNPTLKDDAFLIDTIPPSIDILNPLDGIATANTNILVDGTTEAGIRVDIFNWTALTDGTLISSKSNTISDGTGYYMYNNLKLKTPKDSTNFITAKARDKAGNWSGEVSPRHLVRCITAIGYAYVEPSTNRRLGDFGNPPIVFTWQANASMNNGTVCVDIPSGWSPPSTNKNSAGYVRLYDYSGITFTTGKTLWTGNPSYPRRFKVNFNSANNGGYFKIRYGTNTQTMVSNSFSTAIGLNEWVAKATNTTTEFTNIWNPPKKVAEAAGKTLKIPVIGKPVLVNYTNKMPTQTYKGATEVPAMRIVFINSNNYHRDRIDSIVLTIENAAQQQVNANTRLSSISLWTSGSFYASASCGASPQVVIDLTASPLIIPTNETNIIVDVRMDISPTTSATDIRLNLSSKDDITAKNYENYAGVAINVIGSFPMRTSYAVIKTNQPVRKMWTSFSNFNLKWVEAGQKNVIPMQIILWNTNNQVNDVEVTKVYIKVENKDNTGIVPYSVADWIKLQKKGGGTIYAQKTPESSGDTIVLQPTGLYIPFKTSITCDVKVDIKTNATATNFQLNLVHATNIKARDKLLFNVVTNFAYPGYSFPMRSDNANIVRYFRVEHDSLGTVSVWEPIIFKVQNYNHSIVTNFTGTITLDTTGDVNNISWTNNYTFFGTFTDGGAGTDKAYYTFGLADKGVITLSIKDDTIETIDISASDTYITGVSNNLKIIGVPNVLISKTSSITNPPSYVSLGGGASDVVPGSIVIYTINYTNSGNGSALNFKISDTIPVWQTYKSNSMNLNGSSLSDAVDGDEGDYNGTLANSITVIITNIPASGKGYLRYEAIIK